MCLTVTTYPVNTKMAMVHNGQTQKLEMCTAKSGFDTLALHPKSCCHNLTACFLTWLGQLAYYMALRIVRDASLLKSLHCTFHRNQGLYSPLLPMPAWALLQVEVLAKSLLDLAGAEQAGRMASHIFPWPSSTLYASPVLGREHICLSSPLLHPPPMPCPNQL